jgi:hypothetical protein
VTLDLNGFSITGSPAEYGLTDAGAAGGLHGAARTSACLSAAGRSTRSASVCRSSES